MPRLATATTETIIGRNFSAAGVFDAFPAASEAPAGDDVRVGPEDKGCNVEPAAWREPLAARMADANGSTCAIGSHWDIPSHQQRILGSNRPARQDWMSCSAAKGPVGCLPSPGMYQEGLEAFTVQSLLSLLGVRSPGMRRR